MNNIHWFPGHMNKALHEVEEKVKAEFEADKAAATKLYDSAKAKFCKKEQAQEEKPEEKSDDKKDDKKEDKPKEEKKDDKKEKVNESENATNKSGAELKEQIIDTITRRLFQKGDNKVEVFDLQGYKDGYNVSFVKLSFGEGEKKNG